MDVAVSRKVRRCRVVGVEHCITDSRFLDSPHIRHDISHLAGAQRVDLVSSELQVANLGHFVAILGVRPKRDVHTCLDRSIDDSNTRNGAAVSVVVRIKNQRTQRSIGVSVGCRHAVDNRSEQLVDAGACLGRHSQDLLLRDPYQISQLFRTTLRFGRRQIDLVEDGNDFQPGVHREKKVADRLSLDALGGVDDEHGAFACGERAGYFVREVHVSRRIDEIQFVRGISLHEGHSNRVEFDRDTTFAFEIHGIEDLGSHLTLLERPGGLDHAIGECGLPVIDMGDDAKIADVLLMHGGNIRP